MRAKPEITHHCDGKFYVISASEMRHLVMNAILHMNDGRTLTAPLPDSRMFPSLLVWTSAEGNRGNRIPRYFVIHPDMPPRAGHYREVEAVEVTKVAGEKTP